MTAIARSTKIKSGDIDILANLGKISNNSEREDVQKTN
jgi:hypothetical protein